MYITDDLENNDLVKVLNIVEVMNRVDHISGYVYIHVSPLEDIENILYFSIENMDTTFTDGTTQKMNM